MKIVHTESTRGWGGQELRSIHEITGLVRRGHDVRLVCVEDSPLHRAAIDAGIRCLNLPIARKRIRGVLALRRLFREEPVDLIVTHSSADTWQVALALIGLPQAPPLVRTRHITAQISNTLSSRWLYLKATTHIISAGEVVRRQLMQSPGVSGDNISAIPTGIDTGLFSPGDRAGARRTLGLEPDGIYPGILACLRVSKGHAVLFEAIAKIARPDMRLLVVGDGDEREPLTRLAEKLGITGQIIFAGHQDSPVTWLLAMDCMLQPSLFGEGVPQAVSQAMACGLAVIATPDGGIPEVIEDGVSGILVPAHDADRLAEALSALLDDPERAQRLGEAASAYARGHLGVESMLDKLENLYGSLLENR